MNYGAQRRTLSFCAMTKQKSTWMKHAASEEMMGAWKKWMADREKNLVDKGRPLGKTKRVTANGVSDLRNDLNWYLILEAESHEAAAKMFGDHPHLRIPEASIEVMEIPDRPGM